MKTTMYLLKQYKADLEQAITDDVDKFAKSLDEIEKLYLLELIECKRSNLNLIEQWIFEKQQKPRKEQNR